MVMQHCEVSIMWKWDRILAIVYLLALVAACTSPDAGLIQSATMPSAAIEPTATITPTPTIYPTMQITATPAATLPPPRLTSTEVVHLCSPFPGFGRDALLAAISNPFRPPRLGRDEPHQAVDVAVTQDGIALPGGSVQAMLRGKVAAVIVDRFPYGNALMIETPLVDVPANWLTQLALPTLAPTVSPNPALTCPPVEIGLIPETEERSLYLLYAHFQEAPAYALDDEIMCGAQISIIGQSGNALHPHLHLEVRLGPAGVRFPNLAHYISNASAQEMSNYCTWRVRGVFQLVDPTTLLQQLSQ